MDDQEIIARFFARDEEGLTAARARYEPYCAAVARSLLNDPRDQEECLSDTWLRAWNAIPPQRPAFLGAFLQKIARNLALTAYQAARTQKRGGGQVLALTRELSDCVTGNPEATLQQAELSALLNEFLLTLPDRDQYIFLRRYWHADSVGEIAARCRLSAGTVKSILYRSRQKLRQLLLERGIVP